MREFGLKRNMKDNDFMIHILNSLSDENDFILDGLETGNDMLSMKVFHEKLNHQHEKTKKEENKI